MKNSKMGVMSNEINKLVQEIGNEHLNIIEDVNYAFQILEDFIVKTRINGYTKSDPSEKEMELNEKNSIKLEELRRYIFQLIENKHNIQIPNCEKGKTFITRTIGIELNKQTKT